MVVFDVLNLTEKAEPYKPGRRGPRAPRPKPAATVQTPTLTWGGRRNLHNGEYREASTRDAPRSGIIRGEFYGVRI